MAGNLLGPRAKYLYTSDDGQIYSIQTDQSLAVAKLGAGANAPVEYDPSDVPANFAGRFPRGAKPRVVFAQDANGNRKELVAFSPTADLYETAASQSVIIDTVTFQTTGRRGERYTF